MIGALYQFSDRYRAFRMIIARQEKLSHNSCDIIYIAAKQLKEGI